MEDIENRRRIISQFYHDWKLRNPSLKKFNLSLNEDINIRFVSITETCTHASRTYLSALAVLQLDAILTNAKVVSTVCSKDCIVLRFENRKGCQKGIPMICLKIA